MDKRRNNPSGHTSAWLRLRHCSQVPTPMALLLARKLGGAEAVFDASDTALQAALETNAINRRTLARYCRQAVERDLLWLLERNDRYIITWEDQDYPQLLREIPDPPLLLYVAGNPAALGPTQLAIVGSRNPTPAGKELAYRFASNLSKSGVTVTSGLAIGVDAAAHDGALAGSGVTVAVAATGLDRVYPPQHRALAEKVSRRGALVSEFPIGSPPRKVAFPRRNRIISGLSVGTLVVEAAQRSGSLITARLAGEQGREVFAVPGSILSPQSRGCHALIRDGAKLVETEADIFEELGGPHPPEPRRSMSVPIAAEAASLLDSMGYDPVTVDTLVQRCGLTADAISSMLLRMELQGMVKVMAGGHYIRVG